MEGEDLMEDGLCGNCGSQVEGLGLLACGWKLDAGSWKTQARIMRTDSDVIYAVGRTDYDWPAPRSPRRIRIGS